MTYQTLISAVELHRHLNSPDWAIVDCRYSLKDPQAGKAAYQVNHIPGSVFADLEEDLCGPIVPGKTGRHPLPEVSSFIQRLHGWGIKHNTQVVIYDDQSGAFAARLWWMLRWIGHSAAAVLDGGLQAWSKAGFSVDSKPVQPSRGTIVPRLQDRLVVTCDELLNRLGDNQIRLVDARERVRYLGLEEPIDPVAGHIPGAESRPYLENLNSDGTYKSPAELRDLYTQSGKKTHETIIYCGSGVTAAANFLAYEIAGLGPTRLYVGSWSEWITNPARPIATGEVPEIITYREQHDE